jgi:hypothetical protein
MGFAVDQYDITEKRTAEGGTPAGQCQLPLPQFIFCRYFFTSLIYDCWI